ncbi:hypothetical protein ACHAW5_007226 [Stephanodiscus triporus]|uniref:Uncharacterized protein n=1 Tax=Stephanodiscus triporus TaxID=2934178 RepID=A0ABD3Q6J1_9STRA
METDRYHTTRVKLPIVAIPKPTTWALFSFETEEMASGTWSTHEHELFEKACVHHGWGRWKDIALDVPSRSRSQVKSHAQKFQMLQPKQKEILDMLHKERSRKKQVKDEMKEFALALLNLKHPPNTLEIL